MTDRRRALRFTVGSAAPAEARACTNVVVERLAGDVAVVVSASPAQVGESLVVQVSGGDGSVRTWKARVRSSVAVPGTAAYRIRLRLMGTPRTSPAPPGTGRS